MSAFFYERGTPVEYARLSRLVLFQDLGVDAGEKHQSLLAKTVLVSAHGGSVHNPGDQTNNLKELVGSTVEPLVWVYTGGHLNKHRSSLQGIHGSCSGRSASASQRCIN